MVHTDFDAHSFVGVAEALLFEAAWFWYPPKICIFLRLFQTLQ